MANKRFSSIQGQALRLTVLDECGNPVPGACGTATSDGFISIDLSANINEGDEFEVKTANGKLCVSQKDCPTLRWYDVAATFCNIDPEVFSLMSSAVDLVSDRRGDSVGYAMNEDSQCGSFALELWTKVAGETCGVSPCGPDDCEQWIYWVLPWVTNGVLGDYTIENGPLEVSFTGNTRNNPNWDQGPYNVICLDAVAPTAQTPCTTPGPLADTPVAANQHLYKRLTCVAPPTIDCGCQELAPVAPVTTLP